jgi:uncharacterized delta-60 repeat protein
MKYSQKLTAVTWLAAMWSLAFASALQAYVSVGLTYSPPVNAYQTLTLGMTASSSAFFDSWSGTINWGDGASTPTGASVTASTLTHTYTTNGAMSITLTGTGYDHDFGGSFGSYRGLNNPIFSQLDITVLATPPIILTNPASQMVAITSNASFSIAVTGTAPFGYRWYFNGAGITGGTNNSLTVSNVGYATQGSYTVVVTNNFGSVTSAPASLNVIPLDPTFNGTGKATADMGTNEYTRAMVIQSDGRIVLAGYATGTANNDVALARFNADGTLDTAFNGTGKIKADFGGDEVIYGVALQSDGKILISGYQTLAGNDDFLLLRYNTNGTVDTSFGSSGKVTTAVGSGSDIGRQVAVQSDGKIVVVGESIIGGNFDFAVARYNTNGSLDTTFNGTGKVTTAIGSGDEDAECVVLQNDGKIVAAGRSHNGSNNDFAVLRYNTNGSLDTTFNSTGKVITTFGSNEEIAESMAVQNDGKIVVAGGVYNGSNWDVGLVRYNTNGILDTTFNTTGKVTTTIGSGDDFGYGVAVQYDGKIVVAGDSNNGNNFDFAVVRYNTDGSLDTNFGGTGKLTIPVGVADDHGHSMALQNDGKIVVSGDYFNGSNEHFALLRLGVSPAIGMQPQGLTVECGTSTNMSVAASGYPSPAYQWRLAGTNLIGATNAGYSFAATLARAGGYTVVVTNSFGSVTSTVANATVVDTTPPTVSSAPGSQTNTSDSNCQYVLPDFRGSVSASDCSGVTIAQSPGPGSVLGVGNTLVTLTTTDGFSHVVTNTLTVTVRDITPPTFSVVPHDITILAGLATNLTATAIDCSPVSYQWFRNGSSLAGANAGTNPIPVASATNAGYYTVVATSGGGSVTSSIVLVTVAALPSSTPLATQILFGNAGTVLSVSAYGAPPLSYQWTLNGTNITGANAASYTILGSALNAGSYNVVVSNPYGAYTNTPVAALFFGDLKMYAGTTIGGAVGTAYRVDYADVINGVTNVWQVLTNVILPTTPFIVFDPNSPGLNQRFYRVVTP